MFAKGLKMRVKTVGKSIVAIGLAVASTSLIAQQQAPVITSAQLSQAIDACLSANVQSEFDTLATVAERVSASCNNLVGSVRVAGRGDSVLGDILRYNAEQSRIEWLAPLSMANRFGGVHSPYPHNPVWREAQTPDNIRREFKSIENWQYWLIPISETDETIDSYSARNGLGASTNVSRKRANRYGLVTHIPSNLPAMAALLIPMEAEKARSLIDRMDVILSWSVAASCRLCYKASTKVTGFAASMQSPTEERIENRFLFVKITKIQVVDRMTGEVIQEAVPAG